MTEPDRTPEPMSYDPDRDDPTAVLNVHLAALQEIDRVVGNQKTLDEEDTTRVRGIIMGALSRPRAGSHPAEEAP